MQGGPLAATQEGPYEAWCGESVVEESFSLAPPAPRQLYQPPPPVTGQEIRPAAVAEQQFSTGGRILERLQDMESTVADLRELMPQLRELTMQKGSRGTLPPPQVAAAAGVVWHQGLPPDPASSELPSPALAPWRSSPHADRALPSRQQAMQGPPPTQEPSAMQGPLPMRQPVAAMQGPQPPMQQEAMQGAPPMQRSWAPDQQATQLPHTQGQPLPPPPRLWQQPQSQARAQQQLGNGEMAGVTDANIAQRYPQLSSLPTPCDLCTAGAPLLAGAPGCWGPPGPLEGPEAGEELRAEQLRHRTEAGRTLAQPANLPFPANPPAGPPGAEAAFASQHTLTLPAQHIEDCAVRQRGAPPAVAVDAILTTNGGIGYRLRLPAHTLMSEGQMATAMPSPERGRLAFHYWVIDGAVRGAINPFCPMTFSSLQRFFVTMSESAELAYGMGAWGAFLRLQQQAMTHHLQSQRPDWGAHEGCGAWMLAQEASQALFPHDPQPRARGGGPPTATAGGAGGRRSRRAGRGRAAAKTPLWPRHARAPGPTPGHGGFESRPGGHAAAARRPARGGAAHQHPGGAEGGARPRAHAPAPLFPRL
jgi:hypothetical protein